MLELFRNEIIHFLVSLTLAIAFIPQLGVSVSFVTVFSFGFFLDVDHLFDYGLYLRKFNKKFTLKDFLSGQHFDVTHKMFVLLHSWELVILLWIPYLYLGEIAFWAASLALVAHLIVDQLTNKVSLFSYSIIYRFHNNFKHDFWNIGYGNGQSSDGI